MIVIDHMDWTSSTGRKIVLLEGDITRVAVDAMANAANSALAGGGGVDGAIHRAGGPAIMRELSGFGGCPTGSAVATGAGNLPASPGTVAAAATATGCTLNFSGEQGHQGDASISGRMALRATVRSASSGVEKS